MRSQILAVFTALSLATASVHASEERTMSVAVSPISMFLTRFSALYQYKLFNYLALTVPVKYNYNFLAAPLIKAIEKNGVGEQTKVPYDAAFGIGARFLLNNKGLNDSFYVEPRLWFGYEQIGFKAGNQTVDIHAMKLEPILNFGWDWYWSYGLYMSLGAGVGYAFHFNQTVDIPKELDALKTNAGAGFFFPTTSGTLALDGEFKVGYSW